MSNGNFTVPVPYNEPILDYAPGSPERRELRGQLNRMASRTIEIPARAPRGTSEWRFEAGILPRPVHNSPARVDLSAELLLPDGEVLARWEQQFAVPHEDDARWVEVRMPLPERSSGRELLLRLAARADRFVPGVPVIAKREEDKNGDGNIDVVSIYKNGKLVRREISDPTMVPL